MRYWLYATTRVLEMRKPEEERTTRHSDLLKHSQYWPKEIMTNYQQSKLRALLVHAYQEVPHYHAMFKSLDLKPDNIKNASDLRKLRFLDKSTIKGSLANLTADNLRKKAIPSSTGGSTGVPLKFYTDWQMWSWGGAARDRAWEWAGYELGDKCALLLASPRDISASKSLSSKIVSLVLRRLAFDSFQMSDKELGRFAGEMARFKPRVIRASPTSGFLFARYVAEHDIRSIEPKSIITASENLFPHQRKLIEETFRCPVYDWYGSRETSLVAHECEERCGYHISDENSIVEFIKDGEPVSPGESGEIVITDLNNYVMPWIRYRIEDMGTPTEERCNCGRHLSMMSKIDGRTTDYFLTRSGRRLPGPLLTLIFKDVENVRQFQLVQRRMDSIVVKVVRENAFTERDAKTLIDIVKRYVGDDVDVSIEYMERIDPAKSGKRRFIISEVKE